MTKTVARPRPSHFEDRAVAPGLFRASCHMTTTRYVTRDQLPEEQREALALVDAPIKYPRTDEDVAARQEAHKIAPQYDVKGGGYPMDERCNFETEDVAELRHHLETAHDNRKRSTQRDERGRPVSRLVRINVNLPQPPMRSRWKAPRLTEDGKPFEPRDLDPGAEVTWRELLPNPDAPYGHKWAERSGQVWCTGWAPKSAWVIPFEKFEGETAVLVTVNKLDKRLEHHSTQYLGNGSRRAS